MKKYQPSFVSVKKANRYLIAGEHGKAVLAFGESMSRVPQIWESLLLRIAKVYTSKDFLHDFFSSIPCGAKAAVFASYSPDCIIHKHVIYYLEQLSCLRDIIVLVSDCEYSADEVAKLSHIPNLVTISSRHGEYDFGSYKRGLVFLRYTGIYKRLSELVLCNDSCYGPVNSFQEMYETMDSSEVDFWGITQNSEFRPHLQSFFLCFRRAIIHSNVFLHFMRQIEKQSSVDEVIHRYEIGLTRLLEEAGYSWSSFVDPHDPYLRRCLLENPNPTVFPIQACERKSPLVKVKALARVECNWEGIAMTMKYLLKKNKYIYNLVLAHRQESPLGENQLKCGPKFSIILPVYNRVGEIASCINSALEQSYENRELIVVDDGSCDGLESFVLSNYGHQCTRGLVKFVRCAKNHGVAHARNLAIEHAAGEWIAYLDSDNKMNPWFLSVFYDAILRTPETCVFYASYRKLVSGMVHAQPFDYINLCRENYIDLGSVVHRKSIFQLSGCFDNSLKRLVDWDFILRICEEREPIPLPQSVMIYQDSLGVLNRISERESYGKALAHIRSKYSLPYVISTLLLSSEDESTISSAFKSVEYQNVEFEHLVFLFDDCSQDETWPRYTSLLVKSSLPVNGHRQQSRVGFVRNLRDALAVARGDYVAFLNCDQYWHDACHLKKLLDKYITNPECSVVVAGSESNAELRNCLFRRHVLETFPFESCPRALLVENMLEFSSQFGPIGFL